MGGGNKNNNSGNVILTMYIINRTQLTLIGPMIYYMHVTGASMAATQSCALQPLSISPYNMQKTYVQEIPDSSGV